MISSCSSKMNVPRNICILCSIETNFYITMMDSYCRKNELLKKINICLCMSIKEDDIFNVICHNCVYNVEKFYDFVMNIRKAQTVIQAKRSNFREAYENGNISPMARLYSNKYVKSCTREHLYSSNFSFSFHESMFEDDEVVKIKEQSPAPPDYEFEKRTEPKKPRLWNVKTQPVEFGEHFRRVKECKQRSISNTSHQKANTHRGEVVLTSSRDIFESPSNTQDAETEPRNFDWKLTPDENVMRKIRERYFGRSDF